MLNYQLTAGSTFTFSEHVLKVKADEQCKMTIFKPREAIYGESFNFKSSRSKGNQLTFFFTLRSLGLYHLKIARLWRVQFQAFLAHMVF